MLTYNLTDSQKSILRWIIEKTRGGELSEEFSVYYTIGHAGASIPEYRGVIADLPMITDGLLEALAASDLIAFAVVQKATATYGRVTVLGNAYTAVGNNFGDASRLRLRKGFVIDEWILQKQLGSGGNAEVWRAQREDVTGALKILKRQGREAYSRFADEIRLHQQIDGRTGILPMLDFSLPQTPSDVNPPWLAMPEATSMRVAIERDYSLENVVEAIQAIARTLVDLHERKIFHRDIKPENLFRHDEDWVIADFGIADFPGHEDLTRDGRKLGPMFYLAPEMLQAPETAQGGPADVYSLTKTLWVVATGQNYPPQGEQRTDVLGLTLSHYVGHHRARLLDSLIERGTRHEPADRPTMIAFAEWLETWQRVPSDVNPGSDLGDLPMRLTALRDPEVHKESQRNAIRARAFATSNEMIARVQPIGVQLSQAGFRGIRTTDHDTDSYWVWPTGQDMVWQNRWWTQLRGPRGLMLSSGFILEAYSNDEISIRVAHMYKNPSIGETKDHRNHNEFTILWTDHQRAPVDSPHLEHAMSELANGLIRNLQTAIDQFLSHAEEVHYQDLELESTRQSATAAREPPSA